MQGPFAYDSFTRVNPRKKRKGREAKGRGATPSSLLARTKEELLTTDRGWSQGCVELFHEALQSTHIRPRKVLCLGLGSPSLSRDARAQLAFLSHLCASSHIDSGDVFLYDPAFTDADVELLQTLGMHCLDPVQGAEHALDCPTMLYMPHCDLKLYEQVIRANWTLDGLCSMVFLANRFQDYVDQCALFSSSPSSSSSPSGSDQGHSAVGCSLERESPRLIRLIPFIECRSLPTSRVFPSAFTSLAVQYVNPTPLSEQAGDFWEIPPVR